MPERDTRAADQPAYPAEKARQGEIVLRHRSLRFVFVAGLAAAVILAVVLWLVR
jgi:hypothetical protein